MQTDHVDSLENEAVHPVMRSYLNGALQGIWMVKRLAGIDASNEPITSPVCADDCAHESAEGATK